MQISKATGSCRPSADLQLSELLSPNGHSLIQTDSRLCGVDFEDRYTSSWSCAAAGGCQLL